MGVPVQQRTTSYCAAPGTRGRGSRIQSLAVQPFVEIGDEFRVAVEQQRRAVLADPDQLLARLAPARMWHLGIDVGPEPVFGGLQRLPKALRPLIGEAQAHDRLDRFESVF